MLLAKFVEFVPESLGVRGLQKDPGRLMDALASKWVEICISAGALAIVQSCRHRRLSFEHFGVFSN